MGVLFLTHLRGYDIVSGKLEATSLLVNWPKLKLWPPSRHWPCRSDSTHGAPTVLTASPARVGNGSNSRQRSEDAKDAEGRQLEIGVLMAMAMNLSQRRQSAGSDPPLWARSRSARRRGW
jgi:hypothetical protein